MVEDTTVTSKGWFRDWTDETWAFLLLRLWLATRAIVTGLQKYWGVDEGGQPAFGLKYYKAIPDVMKQKFAAEPMFLSSLAGPFYAALGPVLILSGLMLLLGVGTRISLVVQGLLYVALTYGLILIKQDAGVAWLGIHMGLIALALMLARHNRLAVFRKW